MHISEFWSKSSILRKYASNMHFSGLGNMQKICILPGKMHIFCRFGGLQKCIFEATLADSENADGKMHIFCIFFLKGCSGMCTNAYSLTCAQCSAVYSFSVYFHCSLSYVCNCSSHLVSELRI